MLIKKKISDWIVFEAESIFRALEKINSNKQRIVFIVSADGRLLGSLSDGDFRRWITSTSDYDLNQDVINIANAKPLHRSVNAPRQDIEACFTGSIDTVPLVDDVGRLVAIVSSKEQGLQIGQHVLSQNSPAFLIAEIGNNHNGDIKLAKRLVDLAVEAKADCVKFQMRDMNALYKTGDASDHAADLGAQYTHDLLKRFQLSNDELISIFDYCRHKGLTPLCTPWDLPSLELLEKYGMEAYKVASADFTNHELLEALAATGKPLICSTGMCTEAEIKESVKFLRSKGVEFILLHCNSTYPTPFKDVNLSYLNRLKKITHGLVGYSGHERGVSIPVAAVALGAKVIEKHFTLDKSMEGNDHKVSLLPEEFAMMVSQIREVEDALGTDNERVLTQGEMINRETLAKSLTASAPISKGEVITRSAVVVKSPGQGLQPMYLDALVGRVAKQDFNIGDFFYPSDLLDEQVAPRDYHFSRPFGIPVRYHDYHKLSELSNLDFVEFHLSYQDMDLRLEDFFQDEQAIGFAVHAPELFSGDHLLDLSSEDDAYRERSIAELQRVCAITRELKQFFPKTERPVIVINAGGFSRNGFLPVRQRAAMYERIAHSLSALDQTGVEVIIQTMPPFPWHFGGQSHHNLFVDANETRDFCSSYGYRICLDVSHAIMACNYAQTDLSQWVQVVGQFIAHMHIADALGSDGEGVQIGQGDVDFVALAKTLNEVAPGVQFIPEVWQGHKNAGEGFWHALEFLEPYLH